MNKIFKKVWNKVRSCFVAVSEATVNSSGSNSKGRCADSVSKVFCLRMKKSWFRLTLIAAMLATAYGSAYALTVSDVVVGNVNNLSSSHGVFTQSLSATVRLDSGSSTDKNLASTTVSQLNLGGKNTTNVDISTDNYRKFKDYFVDHHGSSFTFKDSDADFWYLSDSQYAVAASYWPYSSSRRITPQSDTNSSWFEDPKIYTALGNSLSSTGPVNYKINAGTTIQATTLNIAETEDVYNVQYGFLFVDGTTFNFGGNPHVSANYKIIGNSVNATSGPQSTTLINNGGRLEVGTLNICPNCSYVQDSGSTTIGDIEGPGKVIINGGDLTANGLLSIASAKPANIGVKDLHSLANLNAISYAAGTKASFGGLTGLANSLQIGNATLKVGGDLTQHIRDQAVNAIKNRFGAGVNVVFTGNLAVDNSLDLSQGWTSEVLNSVFNENNRANYLFHTLNWNAEGQDKVIGSGDIQKNFGVKNVDNAASIKVNNGATFAILGETATTRLAGDIFIADHGTLIFGANGLASGGTAAEVSVINNGTLNVASGDFTIHNLFLDGTVDNIGTLRLSDFHFGENGRLTSSGTLQADRSKLFSIEDSHVDGLNVVDLGSTQPQEFRQEFTEFFRKYVPENQKVLDEIVNHAEFTGGKVIVTNAHLTETQRDDLIKAFKAKFFLPDAFTSAVSQQC